MNTQVATRRDDNFMPSTPAGAGAMVAIESQRAVAETKAAMYLAKQFPRDQRAAFDRVLQACTRPTLAEKATYLFNRGGTDITGPTIHIAKAIAREWGNLNFGIRELSNEGGESEVEAFCWDIETNTREVKVFKVKHWRDTKKGGYALTDQRDIYELVANQGARRMRACILGIIPGDVVEAAVAQCDKTLKTKIEITPEFLAEVVETFAPFGVTRAMIEKKIQRNFDTLTPAQAMQLRKILNGLREGSAKVADFFEVEGEAAEAVGKGNAGLRDAMKKAEPAAAKPEGAQVGDAAESKPAAGRRAAAAPAVTYATVSDAMKKAHAAKDKDALDVAASTIASVADETVHGELQALYRAYANELAKGGE